MASSVGVDKDLEDLILRDFLLFLALAVLKGQAGVANEGARAEADPTPFRLVEGSDFFLETTSHDEAPESEPSSPNEYTLESPSSESFRGFESPLSESFRSFVQGTREEDNGVLETDPGPSPSKGKSRLGRIVLGEHE